MDLFTQLLTHFAPHPQQRAKAKDPMCGEVVIPERLRNYSADVSALGAFLKPNRPMRNYVSRELPRGAAKTPSYTPSVVPDVGEVPWPVPTAEHSAALTLWSANARQAAKASRPQSLPFNAWLLYRFHRGRVWGLVHLRRFIRSAQSYFHSSAYRNYGYD